MDLVSEVLLEHLLQSLPGLRECHESRFTIVVRVRAHLLERLYEQLSTSCKALADLGRFQPIFPVGKSSRLHGNLRTNGQNAAERLIPFVLINDLVVSRINCVKHVFDNRIAWNWCLRKLAQLSDQSIEI